MCGTMPLEPPGGAGGAYLGHILERSTTNQLHESKHTPMHLHGSHSDTKCELHTDSHHSFPAFAAEM